MTSRLRSHASRHGSPAPRVFAPGLLDHVIARGNRRAGDVPRRPTTTTTLPPPARPVSGAIRGEPPCVLPHAQTTSTCVAPHGRGAARPSSCRGLQQSYTQGSTGGHEPGRTCVPGPIQGASSATTDEYLVTLVRYVHLNPVRAGLAPRPERLSATAATGPISAGDRPRCSIPTLVLGLVGGTAGYVGLISPATPVSEASRRAAGGHEDTRSGRRHLRRPRRRRRTSARTHADTRVAARRFLARRGSVLGRAPDRRRRGVAAARALAALRPGPTPGLSNDGRRSSLGRNGHDDRASRSGRLGAAAAPGRAPRAVRSSGWWKCLEVKV